MRLAAIGWKIVVQKRFVPESMADVFISYSRKDSDFVAKLAAALKIAGRDVWVDVEGIRASEDWKEKIFREIDGANTFLFVVSPDSLHSEIANEEVSHAALNSKRMIPLFYREVHDHEIPIALGRFQGINFNDDGLFPAGVSELLKMLETDLEWTDAHTRLLIRAKEWERERKKRGFLLHGEDLSIAEQMVAKSANREPKLTALQSEYILASRQSATKTQRIIIVAVAAALVVAVGLAIYAFVQKSTAQRNARESKARELAALATEALAEDPERSILLSMEAVKATTRFGQPPVRAAEQALHQSVLSSRVRLTLRGHTDLVHGVAFSPDGSRLATVSDDQTAKVWDAVTGETLLTLRGHTEPVYGVAFSPDGKRLATASGDKTAKIWDAVSGQELLTLRGHSDSVNGVAFSPDGTFLATASKDRTMRLWDAITGKESAAAVEDSISVETVVFGPEPDRLVTGGAGGTARIWDSSRQKVTALGNDLGIVVSVAFSADGTRVATASQNGTEVQVWDAKTGKKLLAVKTEDFVFGVAFSPDGRYLATADGGKTARVWDAASGQVLLTLRGHREPVYGVAFSPDGKRLATASGDQTARVWDVLTGHELQAFRGRAVAFAPEGGRLAITADKTAELWDLARFIHEDAKDGSWGVEITSNMMAWG